MSKCQDCAHNPPRGSIRPVECLDCVHNPIGWPARTRNSDRYELRKTVVLNATPAEQRVMDVLQDALGHGHVLPERWIGFYPLAQRVIAAAGGTPAAPRDEQTDDMAGVPAA